MSKSLADFRKEVLSDSESKEIFESLNSESKIHAELVRARIAAGLSPEDVVDGTGISRENVAKLEGANLEEEAMLNFVHLQKYVDFLDCSIEFKITPKS